MKCNYGDSVYYKKIDKNGVTIKLPASIIDITQVEKDEDVLFFKAPVGVTFYSIEYPDGTTEEFVHEDMIEPYTKTTDK